MKKNKMLNDINGLNLEVPDNLAALHEDILKVINTKKLPWFASTMAVIITTLFCAGYDGSALYLSLASQIRGEPALIIILAIGTTFLLNYSGTVLGDMYKRYVQKVGDMKRWMLVAFLFFIAILFTTIFVYRYSTADSLFASAVAEIGLGGSKAPVETETVSAVAKYSLATIANLGSVVSSFVCFAIGYYNSQPAADQMTAETAIILGLTRILSVSKGNKEKFGTITNDNIKEREENLLKAAKDIADSESKGRKARVREVLVEEKAEDSAEVGDIVESSKNIWKAMSPIETDEDIEGYESEIPEEPYGEDVSEPTEAEETADFDDGDAIVGLFKNITPILPPNENTD